MAPRRAVRLSLKKPTYAVCVVGVETYVDVHSNVPKGAESFEVSGSSGVKISVVYDPARVAEPTGKARWPLGPKVEVIMSVDTASKDLSDLKVKVSYFRKHEDSALGHSTLYLTGVDISLDVDTSRKGRVKRNRGDKKTWHWGPEGYGAILLVNCDRDNPRFRQLDLADSRLTSLDDLKDMSPMVLTCDGPDKFFDSHKLVLNVPFSDSKRVGVFCAKGGNSLSDYKQVLGPRHLSYNVERHPGERKITFYVEGLTFPDADFLGLVSLSVSLVDMGNLPEEVPLFTDTVVFRMSPWIMTPNTQPPLELYVCSVLDRHGSNEKFLKDISALVLKAKCKLIICPWTENRNDRWIQDEMEFGYVEAPHKSFPVVFDSPRDRGLKDFAYKKILGPDFGYVTREIPFAGASGLDSFGNLDISPPVTVGGKEYPLGRILIGSNFPRSGGRRMAKVVRDFLKAQQVQAPVELYSDWLSVGHVDEFLSFVPTSDKKGFRLLLASPSVCLKLFREKKEEGYGEAAQFDGLEHQVKRSINDMLADRRLRSDSHYVQKCIDWNRELLKQELGLAERDIVDIPQLFVMRGSRAEAFFPDMVNMVVLGKHLGIPKPFGPIINGRCCLEEKVRSLLEPLGLHCTFINDYLSYHKLQGEIHCGTNVRREPFSFKWWHMVP
ncbi:peptidyl arginine deiminase 1 [Rhinolophus ferrumequinum]|uniref:Protein-arginine deiminase n=1 Tax=Rhinolophus ferrumequinum TaxID=59479 RepID=A0A671F9W0_RHIFE|nr:protein-arginine deiminase type-1 [Rhinolophus ferrumequinum]KAF6345268.1 peptidyl arginine deiminase 1 [Rhinolophus ferrumequinum]